MLQKIRDRISGWVSIVIIVLVGGAFILFGIQYYFEQSGVGDANTAAKVNGKNIPERELQTSVTQLQKQMGTPPSAPMLAQMKSYVLQSLITQTALITTLEKENFLIALPQVKSLVMNLQPFQDNGRFSQEKFLTYLTRTGQTEGEFLDKLRSEFIVKEAMQSVGGSAFVLPKEVSQFYALQHQTRTFGYFVIPMQRFLPTVTVTNQMIQQYYKDHADEFKTPEKVSFQYILLAPAAIAKTVSVTDLDAKTFYQTHVQMFSVPARYIVSQITIPVDENATATQAATAKASIEKIAAQLKSHQKTTVPSAKMTLNDAAIPEALHTLLSSMSVGNTSAPLRTQHGYTLLTLVKKEPATTRSFESVKVQLIALLKHQKVSELLANQTQTLTDLTYRNADSLAQAAEALHLPIQTTDEITQQGLKTGPFSKPQVLNALFSPEALASHQNSNVIGLDDGSQLVARVLKHEPSTALSLAAVQDQIKKTLTTQQAVAKAGVLAYTVNAALQAGVQPDQLSAKYHLVWKVVSASAENKTPGAPLPLLNSVFATPVDSAKKGHLLATNTVMMNSTDYAAFGITKVTLGDYQKADKATQQKVGDHLSTMWSQLLQHAFVGSIVADSKIVTLKQS